MPDLDQMDPRLRERLLYLAVSARDKLAPEHLANRLEWCAAHNGDLTLDRDADGVTLLWGGAPLVVLDESALYALAVLDEPKITLTTLLDVPDTIEGIEGVS